MSSKYFQQPGVTSSQSHFAAVPSAEIPRSKFDRSHAYKTAFDAGLLIPVFVDEVVPGDTFDLNSTSFARLATPLKPIMDNLYLDLHFFFVPTRLTWSHWQEFCGERLDPDDDPTTFSIPQASLELNSITPTSLANYFGIPYVNGYTGAPNISALPFRAYYLIWNEWYRDQNLQDRIPVSLGNGPDSLNSAVPLRRGKRHDYFTSCLPWPQKGDPVVIPLGGSAPLTGRAPISGIGAITGTTAGGGVSLQQTATPQAPSANTGYTGSDGIAYFSQSSGVNSRPEIWAELDDARSTAAADLSSATAVTINDLRTAFQIQRLLERDARGGTRYIELVLSHFGVRSDDARLQRPEFLGGGSSRISIAPVASTAVTTSVPQANLAAVGTSVNRAGFTKSFTEHGFIIGLASARADLTYQQGLERFWSRLTRYDFYWPALAHLGEQAVLNKEIFISGGSSDEDVFGYQERYAEYRYKPSRITGLFNSNFASSLDVWHLSQDFSSAPALNDSFIQDNPPIDRVIAVPSEPHFLADFWFDLKCSRPMPVYSVPGLIDHF